MTRVTDVQAISVVLTAQCNIGCAYCYQDRRPARRMSWETLQQAVDLLLRSRRPEVTLRFYGGEPLLAFPLLKRAVEYARAECPTGKRLRFGISTNGLLLTEERAAFLARHRVETQISFDGVPAAQDQRRPGSFPVLDGLLDRLHERHPVFVRRDLNVNVTLTGANLTSLAESIEYFIDKGLSAISLNARFTHDPDWEHDSIHELDRQFERILRRSVEVHRTTGRVPLELFRPAEPSTRADSGAMCGVGDNGILAIDVDGQTAGCLLFADSYQGLDAPMLRERVPKLRLGSFTDPAFPERLAGQSRALREAELFDRKAEKHSSYGDCGTCAYLKECLACPMSIGHIPGNDDPRRVPDLQCAFNLVSLAYRSRFLEETEGSQVLRQVLIPDLARRIRATIPAPAP